MSVVKEFAARHRFAHITARKARYVADLIRGRSVNEALELLQFTPNRGAAFYGKVLRSAIANASQDEDVNINRLVVSHCTADDGPLLQGRLRYRPGPQGRAMPYAKKLSHLTIRVRESPGEARPKKGSIAEPAPAAAGTGEETGRGQGAGRRRAKPAGAARPAKGSTRPRKAPPAGARSTGVGPEETKA